MKTTVLAILALFFSVCTSAQTRCGFDERLQRLKKDDPEFSSRLETIANKVRQSGSVDKNGKQIPLAAYPTVYIPVVVHVVHTGGAEGTAYNPGSSQINAAINYLNAVFDGSWTGSGGSILGAGNLDVQFVLATRDPNNNPTTGINRVNGSGLANYSSFGVNAANTNGATELSLKNLVRWDPFKYYNIWLVNKIDDCDGITGCPSFIAGYAYPPFGYNTLNGQLLDGTVMLASQMVAGEKTLPHEIGHALGLFHPFEGENIQPGPNGCPMNDPNDGDFCADTNPITNPADDNESFPFSCRTGNGCYGLAYNSNTELNFMNYTSCYRLFTDDQEARMHAAAEVTMRASLATSWTNNQGLYPTTWSAPIAPLIIPISSLQSNNVAGISKVALMGREVYSMNATLDGGYVDNAGKWYNLFALSRSSTYTMQVTVQASFREQLGVYLDYNNDGDFADSGEELFLNNDLAANAGQTRVITFNFSTPTALSGAIVRMRIINDLSIIYGAPAVNGSATTLRWGQAEDYPVYLQPSVLPVALLQFEGIRSGIRNELSWKTENEINLKNFLVELSPDGRAFQTIGTVTAKGGNSTYYFTDAINRNTVFYRLKMIDNDGSFQYSKIISIENEHPLIVIGNPLTGTMTINLSNNEGPVHVRLLDAMGRNLWQQKHPAGSRQISFTATDRNLSSGLYFVEIQTDSRKLIKKFHR